MYVCGYYVVTFAKGKIKIETKLTIDMVENIELINIQHYNINIDIKKICSMGTIITKIRSKHVCIPKSTEKWIEIIKLYVVWHENKNTNEQKVLHHKFYSHRIAVECVKLTMPTKFTHIIII